MKKITIVLFTLLAFALSACQSFSSVNHVTPAPSPQCVKPALTLGSLNYEIKSVSREPNSFPDISKPKKNVAYWVEDTTINYVFALSPTKDNLALNSVLKAGDPAVINWADCSKDEYVVKSMETIPAGDQKIFDQTSGGITIYVLGDSSTLVIRGERPIVQPAETAAPVPTSEFQVDISLLDSQPADAQTVKIALEITNRGSQTITLDEEDISLTAGSNTEVFPSSAEPVLPQELKPGVPLTISISFPKPQASSAVLRIFDTMFDYYFQ
jgi:hypothetical protein